MKQQIQISWIKLLKKRLTLFKNRWDLLRNPKGVILQQCQIVMCPCHPSGASEDLCLSIMFSNMVVRLVANSKVNYCRIFRVISDPQTNMSCQGLMRKYIHQNQATSSSNVNQKLLILQVAAMLGSQMKINLVLICHSIRDKKTSRKVTSQSGQKNVEVLQVLLVILSISALSKEKVQREDQMMRELLSRLPMSIKPSSKSTKFKCSQLSSIKEKKKRCTLKQSRIQFREISKSLNLKL